MAHFAQIDDTGTVINVVVVPDSQEDRGQDYLANDLGLGGTWVQTSYNTRGGIHSMGKAPLRKNYAGIGFTYDSQRDAFIPPKMFPSWTLNESTCLWQAPIPYPTDGKRYVWNESALNWTPHPTNPIGAYAWNMSTYSWDFAPQDGKRYRWDNRNNVWLEIASG